MERRKQFTFYRSYFEAIQELGKNDKTAVLLAVCAYALDGTEPKLCGPASAVFKVIRPTLDAGRRKAMGGMAASSRKDEGKSDGEVPPSGEKKAASSREDAAKMGASMRKDTANKKKKEGEKEIEIENECYSPYPLEWQEERFAAFLEAYPRKTGRMEARDEWMRLWPDQTTVDKIMGGLTEWKRTESWKREGGRYVPSASKWLFDRRWEWCPAAEQAYPSGASGELGQAELEAIQRVLADTSLDGGGDAPWRPPGEAGT